MAQSSGVKIWHGVDSLTSDVAADADLGGFSGAALGLAVSGDRLVVASNDATNATLLLNGLMCVTVQ